MHSHSKIRYVFISYEDLKEIKFKKLEKICDKIFILINEGINNLPFSLVQKIQKLGKNAKWIQISNKEDALALSMSFLMGQMHEKINKDIEFAILSNDKQYDNIVYYLNSVGRDCIRVKNKKKNIANYSNQESVEPNKGVEVVDIENETEKEVEQSLHSLSNELDHAEQIEPKGNLSLGNTALDILTNGSDSAQGVKIAANETIKRLIRSGNRPSELSLLKSYIILHNQNESIEENIEDIIDHLAGTNEIEIREDEVIYNF